MADVAKSSRKGSSTFEIVSRSVEETQQLGEALGRLLAPGDVLGLCGELGSGKTTFIQGLAKGLGINQDLVRSPTFILLRDYPGRLPLIHVDGYRLDGAPAAVWLDVEWLFDPKKVTVIEWADRITDCLPEDYLEMRFAHKTTNQRAIAAVPHGSRATQVVGQLRKVHARPGD